MTGITGKISLTVFEKLNRYIKDELNLRMILIIDNCLAHPDTGLKFSNVNFLHPNTISVIQRLDARVIKSFKSFYRLRLCLISIIGFHKT